MIMVPGATGYVRTLGSMRSGAGRHEVSQNRFMGRTDAPDGSGRMSAQTAVKDEEPQRRSACWCCGRIEDPHRLVHLGKHPGVAVCTRCAYSISKWASEIEDRPRTGLAVRARYRFRQVRKVVVRRG
jgi:hypothetical protein